MNEEDKRGAGMSLRLAELDGYDDFPTPKWATRALCEHIGGKKTLRKQSVWEPAAGRGDMAEALGEYFKTVHASDILKYREDYQEGAFVPYKDHRVIASPSDSIDWVITNPPFNQAEGFLVRALETAKVGVAMFLRIQFLETIGRYERVFQHAAPSAIYQFTERVPLCQGRIDPTISTATSYCWLIWLENKVTPCRSMFTWIPPCRKKYEKNTDYDRYVPKPVSDT